MMMITPITSILVILVASLQFIPPIAALSIEETFCINFAATPSKLTSPLFFKDAKLFGANTGLLVKKTPPTCMITAPTKTVNKFYRPQIYGILDSLANRTLNNWIQYELNFFHINNDDMDAIIIQADTDKYVGFGQFVPIPEHQPDSDPLPTQFMHCSFQQSEEPLPPTIFVYTKDGTNAELAKPTPLTLKLYWRFSQNMCNTVGKVTFRGIFVKKRSRLKFASRKTKLIEKLQPLVFFIPPITITLSNDFAGQAPSPFPTHGRIIISSVTSIPWVKSVEENLQSAQTFSLPPRCSTAAQSNAIPPFFGCGQVMPKCENPQTLNANVFRNHPQHPEYDDYVYHRLQAYCFCPRPFRRASPEPILHSRDLMDNVLPLEPKEDELQESKTVTDKDSSIDGVPVVDFPGDYVWNYRIMHGIAHVVSGLFITPLSIFVTRNYKETFMKTSWIFNKPWFILHMLSVFINFLLHAIGMLAIFTAKQLLGVSYDADSQIYKDHKLIGFGNTILFISLMLLGGIRSYNTFIRRICIAIHWFMGILYYLSTLYLIHLSVNIPGSPSDGRKLKKDPLGRDEASKNLMSILIVIWISVDVGFHLTMMVLSYIEDHTLRIHRKLWVVPIPSLHQYNKTDLPGSFSRKILLFVYVCIALIICSMACILIAYPPQPYQGFGKMSCSHEKTQNGTFNLSLAKLLDCKLLRPFEAESTRDLVKNKINLTSNDLRRKVHLD